MEYMDSVIDDMNNENLEQSHAFYSQTPEPEFGMPKKIVLYMLVLCFLWLIIDDIGRKLVPRYIMLVCSCYGFIKLVEFLLYLYGSYSSSSTRRRILDDFFANSDVEDF